MINKQKISDISPVNKRLNRLGCFGFFCIAFITIALTDAAWAECIKKPVFISIQTRVPEPIYYHHLSGTHFPDKPTETPATAGMEIRGLTSSEVSVTGKASSYVENNNRVVCVGLKEIIFTIGLKKLDVYIDKKYPLNSCAYRTIKEHENIHVGIFQQAVPFFRPDIETELKKALDAYQPISIYASQATQQLIAQMTTTEFNQIMRDIKPLITHINQKIVEKNELIDTPESYRQMSRRCSNW